MSNATVVGADAHIGPPGSYGFAEEFHKNSAFCRVDVGIAPTNRWAAACCLTSLALPRQCTI